MEWGTRKRKLSDTIQHLSLLPTVVVQIVTEYCSPIEWNSKPFLFWSLPNKGRPRGLTTDGTYLYICDSCHSCIQQYTLTGTLIDTWSHISGSSSLSSSASSSSASTTTFASSSPSGSPPASPTGTIPSSSSSSFSSDSLPEMTRDPSFDSNTPPPSPPTSPIPLFTRPYAIDYHISGYLSIIDETTIKLITLKKEILNTWSLDVGISSSSYLNSSHAALGLSLKIDIDCIYTTIDGYHQIFVYNLTGRLIKKYGKEKSSRISNHSNGNHQSKDNNLVITAGENEFQQPYGLTFDSKNLYICDCRNHRVQILNKKIGTFERQFGSQGLTDGLFHYPRSIHLSEDICYIADDESIQLFTKDGIFLQRIKHTIHESGSRLSYMGQFHDLGIVIIEDKLFLSNELNNRIQVWKIKD